MTLPTARYVLRRIRSTMPHRLLVVPVCLLGALGMSIIRSGYVPTLESVQTLVGESAVSFTQVTEDTPVDMALLRQRLNKNGWSITATFMGPNMTSAPLIGKTKFHGQGGQDKTVLKLLDNKAGGYFVDMAANDALDCSNTVALEQNYGWRGLCVEANPRYLPSLQRRHCQLVHAAVGRVDDEEVKFAFETAASGGIVSEDFDNHQSTQPVTFRTLSVNTLLRDMGAPAVMDYLSLDIETFPWDKYRFQIITVERPKPELQEALALNHYIHLCDHADWGDQLWVHESLPRAHEWKEHYHKLPILTSTFRDYVGGTYRDCNSG